MHGPPTAPTAATALPRATLLRGYAAALGAAVLVGTANAVTRHGILIGARPLALAALAYVLAALIFFPFTVRFRLREARDLLPVLASATLGMIIAPTAIFFGLERTTAVTASLLVNLEVLFTVVLAAVFLGERVNRVEAFALGGIAVGGLIVTVGPDLARGMVPEMGSLIGAGLVAVAVMAWAVDNSITTPLTRRYDLKHLVGVKLTVGAVALSLAAAASGGLSTPRAVWPHAAFIALGGVSLSILLLYSAFRTVGATRAIVIFATAGFWGAFAGWLGLGEPLTWPHVLGAAIMLAGVVVLARAVEAESERATPEA